MLAILGGGQNEPNLCIMLYISQNEAWIIQACPSY